MKFKPLGDRILVQRAEEEDQKSAGGIIIPDTAKEKPSRGKVVEVGPGAMKEDGTRSDMELKKGDEVLFGKYSGTDVNVDGEEYLIMRESDVLGVLQ